MSKPDSQRRLNLQDQLIIGLDRIVRSLHSGSTSAQRHSPAEHCDPDQQGELQAAEKRHVSGLMRVNHTGEVCAQALYQGQALTARDPQIRQSMQESADEEQDHLAWCEQRLDELDSRPSRLNPLFYGLSFAVGAFAGAAGDKWSLGFVAATEDQVCDHLRDHLAQLPPQDQASRAIIEQMLIDEEQHGAKALAHGGVEFAPPVKKLMTAMSRVMTRTVYHV